MAQDWTDIKNAKLGFAIWCRDAAAHQGWCAGAIAGNSIQWNWEGGKTAFPIEWRDKPPAPRDVLAEKIASLEKRIEKLEAARQVEDRGEVRAADELFDEGGE